MRASWCVTGVEVLPLSMWHVGRAKVLPNSPCPGEGSRSRWPEAVESAQRRKNDDSWTTPICCQAHVYLLKQHRDVKRNMLMSTHWKVEPPEKQNVEKALHRTTRERFRYSQDSSPITDRPNETLTEADFKVISWATFLHPYRGHPISKSDRGKVVEVLQHIHQSCTADLNHCLL